MPDSHIKTVVRTLPQKNESVSYKYFISKAVMLHFGETFDDFTLLLRWSLLTRQSRGDIKSGFRCPNDIW
jgi:hypothetical protein